MRAERPSTDDEPAEIEGRSYARVTPSGLRSLDAHDTRDGARGAHDTRDCARGAHDDSPPPRRWGRFLVLFALAVVLVGGGAWAWLVHGKRMTALLAGGGGDGVAVVRADPTPFKIRPRDPGGMEVPDRDKLIYGRLQGEATEPRVERLLPPAEAPMRPPLAASAPAPQVTERLPRTPTEAQVRAAVKPPPVLPPVVPSPRGEGVAIARELARATEPTPEDSPPTDTETAPSSPLAAPAAEPQLESKPQPMPLAPVGGPMKEPPTPLARGDSVIGPPIGGTARPPREGGDRGASFEARGDSPARPAAPAELASGYLIQVAAVREPERADAEWERLQRQHPETLRGLKLFVARVDLGDKGVFWRLRAGPFADETAAKNLCAELAQRKVGCLVVKAQG